MIIPAWLKPTLDANATATQALADAINRLAEATEETNRKAHS